MTLEICDSSRIHGQTSHKAKQLGTGDALLNDTIASVRHSQQIEDDGTVVGDKVAGRLIVQGYSLPTA